MKKVVQDIGVIGISKILISISGIILLPFLTRYLGAYGYGLWSQTVASIGLMMPFVKFGLPFSLTRIFPGKDILKIREDFYSILIFIILSAGSISILLYSFPRPLGDAIFEGELIIVRMLAVILFVSCLDRLFTTVFRAFREIKKVAIIRVTRRYIEVALAIILVLGGYGIIGAIVALLVGRSIFSTIMFGILNKKLPFRKPNFSALKEYLNFGVPAIPAMITHKIVSVSDRYVIGFFLGATFVGYYTPGYSLGLHFPSLITAGLGMVLLPTVSDYYEDNNLTMVKRILRLSVKYFLLIAIPYFIGALVLGKPILRLFTTAEIAREGYMIISLSAFAGILMGVYTIFKQIIFLKKRTKLISLFWGLGAGINIVGNILLVPEYGIIAAGFTTILSYFVVMILVLRFSSKTIVIKIDKRALTKIIFSSALMGIIVFLAREYVWSNLFFLIFLGIIIYFLVMFIIGGIDRKEIDFIKNIRG